VEEIVKHLQASIQDHIFSKAEKAGLKALLGDRPLSEQELIFLRSKIYELAAAEATPENYSFVLDWIKDSQNALISLPQKTATAFFSPGEECRQIIIQQIKQAIRQVSICVFTISDDRISDSIITAYQRGVDIKIITDNDKSWDEGSDIKQLAHLGIAVKMDATPNHMHHKFMIADNRSLLTGSYNWTMSAARVNHENVLLTEEAGVVRSYLKEFDSLWKQMVNCK